MRRKGLGILVAAAGLLGCGSERLQVSVGDSIDDARRVFAKAAVEPDHNIPLACVDPFDAYRIGTDGLVIVYHRNGVVVSIEEERVGRGNCTRSEVLLPPAR